MRPVRVFTMVLAGGLVSGPLLFAQGAPQSTGDVARGKTIFESSKGNCMSCHRVNGTGSLYGPDLSAIGAPPRAPAGGGQGRGGAPPVPPAGPTPQQFTQKLLEPNASVSVQNRYVRLVMKDGKTLSGKL